jgi:cytochrome b
VLKVWDSAVRTLHWAVVGAVAAAALSVFWFGGIHEGAGYLALAAVGLRVLWGVFGSRYARFGQFVRTPSATLDYARRVWARREPRYLGHNPLGGWMVLALMGCVTGLAVSGWLYRSDRFWGDETVEAVHRALAWVLLGLFGLHLVGVVFTSRRHRENLVRAMLNGRKRSPAPGDVV